MATKRRVPIAKEVVTEKVRPITVEKEPETEPNLNRRPTAADKAKATRDAEVVGVTVPTAFKLMMPGNVIFDYGPTTREMPRGHAESAYAVAHGVTINE